MTVKELRKILNNYPDEADVKISYSSYTVPCDCGDYCYCQRDDIDDHISYVDSLEPQNVKMKSPITTILIHV